MTLSSRFISGNERRRIAHFDETIEGTASFLDDPHAEDVMGAPAVNRHIDTVSRLRLPNFTNGNVDISHFDDTDIPFIATFKGDLFHIDDALLAPNNEQRQVLEARFGKGIVRREWSRYGENMYVLGHDYFEEMGGDMSSDASQYAFTHSRRKWMMVGRPVLVENGEVHISRFTPVMIHELAHLEQYESMPYYRHKDHRHVSIGNEALAYRRQCLAAHALDLMGRRIDLLNTVMYAPIYDEYASEVDAVTSRHVGSGIDFKFTLPMTNDIFAFDPTITGMLVDD